MTVTFYTNWEQRLLDLLNNAYAHGTIVPCYAIVSYDAYVDETFKKRLKYFIWGTCKKEFVWKEQH